MAKQTVTIDDFSALVTYSPFEAWLANNATNQIWDDARFGDGTWHVSSVDNATVHPSLSFRFSGTAFTLYGNRGPGFGSFNVAVDGVNMTTATAHADVETFRQILANATDLPHAQHEVVLTNLGATQPGDGQGLLFDYAEVEIISGAAGATLTNTTVDDNDPRLVYTGQWANNTNPVFIGGTTTFTNSSASVSLNFTGSTVYVIGDRVEDHGPYTVTLDGQTTRLTGKVPTQLGDFKNTLMYLATDLDANNHTLTIENIPSLEEGRPGVASFFDLDAIIITTPSEYGPAIAGTNNTAPNASASNGLGLPSPSDTPRSGAHPHSSPFLLALFCLFLSTRMFRR